MEHDLTSEQEALMRSVIEEWVKVPFDTSPVDREKAEAAINLTYECVEEERPKNIIWFDNPLDAIIWMLENGRPSGSVIANRIEWSDEFVDSIEIDIPTNICATFNNNFNKFIHRKYFWWASEYFLANFIEYYIAEHFKNLLGKEKFSDIWLDLRQIARWQTIGMHDTYDLAAGAFYHAIGYDRSEFRGHWEAAKHCGMWWAGRDFAVATPKPTVIRLDDEYKLHAEEEPAIVYKGFELYAHHGKYIDSKIIK